MASPVGLQQLQRTQGIEWGDGAGHDYHLWFDGGTLNTDAAFNITAANPFPLSFATANATGSANGQPINLTTGNAGPSGNPQGGDVNINLGTGTGSGRDGEVRIAQVNNVGFYTTISTYGIGLGTQATIGRPLTYIPSYTDPTYVVAPITSNATVHLTTANSQSITGGDFEIFTGTDGNNFTGTVRGCNAECQVNNIGGTLSAIAGYTSYPQTKVGSTAAVTYMAGVQTHPQVAGTGTVATMYGYDTIGILNPSGGTVDGNITAYYGFQSGFQNNSTAATPGTISTAAHFRALAPTYNALAPATPTVYGVQINSQFNTNGHTSTTGGYITYAGWFQLGTQGGNTSGTNNMYGLYLTGAGGSSGAGGTVNNYGLYIDNTTATATGSGTQNNFAIFSAGTAPSQLAGKTSVLLAVTDPTALSQGLVETSTMVLTGANSNNVFGADITVNTGTDTNAYNGTYVGVHSTNTYFGTGAGSIANLTSITGYSQSNTTASGAVTLAMGGDFRVMHFGTGTVGSAYGLQSQVLLRASGGSVDGNITTGFALYSRLQNLSNDATPGVITNGYGWYADSPAFGSGSPGSISTIYGGRIANQGSTHSTSAYGLYLDAQSGATTNIGIFNNDDYCVPAGATNMTKGFVYIPSAAGAPSGTPTNYVSGRVALYWDATNLQLYAYTGSWKKSAAFT